MAQSLLTTDKHGYNGMGEEGTVGLSIMENTEGQVQIAKHTLNR